jgi:hypothetical protein
MYYHYAILLLFRPFLKLDIIGSSVSPRDVCSQAADAISALVNSYSKLYSLRRTPSFVPYFVLTSSITHLVTLGNTGVGQEKLQQGLADLKEMATCHRFAVRAVNILHYLLDHWKVNHSIPSNSNSNEGDEGDQDLGGDLEDEEAKACRTHSISLNLFCPNVDGVDILKGIGPVVEGENPLFWPFPLQGRPLIDVSGTESLEKNGFQISKLR